MNDRVAVSPGTGPVTDRSVGRWDDVHSRKVMNGALCEHPLPLITWIRRASSWQCLRGVRHWSAEGRISFQLGLLTGYVVQCDGESMCRREEGGVNEGQRNRDR